MLGSVLIAASAVVSGLPAVPVEKGTTRVRLDVTAEGTITGCTLTVSSGVPRLDAQALALLQAKGFYEPALDEGGQPMASSMIVAIDWRGAA